MTRHNRVQHLDGALNCVAAAIEQAVWDFLTFRRRGIIKDGALNESHPWVQVRRAQPRRQRYERQLGYQGAADVVELIHFFEPGGGMDSWLELTGLRVDGDMVRQQLGVRT